MSEPKASVVICTMREEPNLHLTLECLKRQTYKNFELIYVDAILDKRSPEFLEQLKSYREFFPITHIKDKQKENTEFRPKVANARNTGIIYSSGEAVLMISDRTWFSENWIWRHMQAFSKSYNSGGPCCIIDCQEDLSQIKFGTLKKHPNQYITEGEKIIGGNICVELGGKTYNSPMDCRLPGLPDEVIFNDHTWVTCPGGWMHTLNVQYDVERLLNINGFNENYDKIGYGFEDCDLGFRLLLMGFPQAIDTGNWVVQFKTGALSASDAGIENKKMYDKLANERMPVWANPELDLRKMREEILGGMNRR